MTRNYMVVYERAAEDNWGGWAPDVGGAVGAGDSLELARQSLREGISIQLKYLAEQGREAPPATCKSIDFSVFEPDLHESHYEIEWMTVALPELSSKTQNRTAQAA